MSLENANRGLDNVIARSDPELVEEERRSNLSKVSTVSTRTKTFGAAAMGLFLGVACDNPSSYTLGTKLPCAYGKEVCATSGGSVDDDDNVPPRREDGGRKPDAAGDAGNDAGDGGFRFDAGGSDSGPGRDDSGFPRIDAGEDAGDNGDDGSSSDFDASADHRDASEPEEDAGFPDDDAGNVIDAGNIIDAGKDGGVGEEDAGERDAGSDAGNLPDSGPDAGPYGDAGADAGTDGGADGGVGAGDGGDGGNISNCLSDPTLCDDHDGCTEGDRCAPLNPEANQNGCVAGTRKNTDDGVFCTLDTCDPETGQVNHTPFNGACDTQCNTVECNETNGCQYTPANGGTCQLPSGEQGNCIDGECSTGCLTNEECEDGKACTTNYCDDTSHLCRKTLNDAACADNNVCNGDELCFPSRSDTNSQGCIPADTRPICEEQDGKSCTHPTCDPSLGCTETPNHNECDDGNLCTGRPERCEPADVTADPMTGCENSPNVDCSAQTDQCNTGICNPLTGDCSAVPVENGTQCNDNRYCTIEDHCKNGVCISNVDRDCSDEINCTIDACSNQVQMCTHLPSDALCSDNNPCTTDECTGTECANTEIPCSIDDQCKVGVCDPETGDCGAVNVMNNTPCNDLDFCSDNDSCQEGNCVGTLHSCEDNIPCTDDSCSVEQQECLNVPNNNICTNLDGQFCNGEEICAPTDQSANSDGCISGTPVNCDNGNLCQDRCDEENDECVQDPPESKSPEICDGADNNCDTFTDEDFPGKDDACLDACNLGACRDGVKACENGEEVCDTVEPVPEIPSNNIDEDCDGANDDGSPCIVYNRFACNENGMTEYCNDPIPGNDWAYRECLPDNPSNPVPGQYHYTECNCSNGVRNRPECQ